MTREKVAIAIASFLFVVLVGLVLYAGFFATDDRPAAVLMKDGTKYHCTQGLVLHSYGWMLCAWKSGGNDMSKRLEMNDVRSIAFTRGRP
ncbi:MAG: hypothetical protein ACXVWF_08630 [Actinomycetota bacterium]